MAREWHDAAPRTPEEIRGFYERTSEYVWELLAWNLSGAYAPYVALIDRVCEAAPRRPRRTVLDHGAGVGSAALAFARRGFDVTIADVPGQTLDFARMRLQHHDVDVEVVEVVDEVPDFGAGLYDAVVSFDVLEHVTRPLDVASALRRALRPDGVAAIVAHFDHRPDTHPHHLPEHVARFAGHRWEMHMRARGWIPRGGDLYRPATGARRNVERLRYALWRATGLHVEHRPA
jgi:SAM-dependent methyltransferase